MATSGTTNFNLDLADIFEEAFERAGSELRSGYDYKTARRSLDLLMLEWQNRGLNLWTVRDATQTLTAGTASYDLTSEKQDIIEGLLRTTQGLPQAVRRDHSENLGIIAGLLRADAGQAATVLR